MRDTYICLVEFRSSFILLHFPGNPSTFLSVDKNVQVEVVYSNLLAIHHTVGGALMIYGWYTGNPAIWAQGAIIDLVDAIHDTALMVLAIRVEEQLT